MTKSAFALMLALPWPAWTATSEVGLRETVADGMPLFWSFLALNLAIVLAARGWRAFKAAQPRKETNVSKMPQILDCSVNNDQLGLQAALDRLREFGEDRNLSVRTVLDLCFMGEEMLFSVLSRAFAKGEQTKIRIQAAEEQQRVRLNIEWEGKAFDPLNSPHLSLNTSLEDISLDGLEIHLLRRFCDELGYTRQGSVNRLHAVRRIAVTEPARV